MAQDSPTQAIWRAYYTQHPDLAPGSISYVPPTTPLPAVPAWIPPLQPAPVSSWFSRSTSLFGFQIPNVFLVAALGLGGLKLLQSARR
jgi:hypothetical protein